MAVARPKARIQGQPLLFTLVFMAGAGAATLGDAALSPDAIVRQSKTHVQVYRDVTRLTVLQLATWRVRLGCRSDCVVSKGTPHGPPRRIENGVPDRLNGSEAATMAATLLATVEDCIDINTAFGEGSCDPATQSYDVRLSGSRLITRFDAAVALMGRAPPLDLPPPPPFMPE